MQSPPAYTRDYSQDGEPLFLVGDILGGYASWSAHAERLADAWRVIATSPLIVAYAAQGQYAPAPWSMDTEGEALKAALDERGIEAAHVGGWSLGGAVALNFAMAHPERVRSLLLVEPQVRWVLRATGNGALADADRAVFAHFGSLTDVDEGALSTFLHRVGAVALDEDARESRAWRLAWTNRLAIRYSPRIVEHAGDAALLADVHAPALLVRGERTTPPDIAMTDALAGLLPSARLHILPGGHTSHMTSMESFLAELAGFLRGDAPPARG